MTKEKLVQATIKNVAKFGYQGASMRKIAEEVGIKPASIYHFFPNKQELVIEAMRMILNHHFSSMRAVFEKEQHTSINVVFSELFNSLVFHHRSYQDETQAYVLMVNSEIPEIKVEVQKYLENYNEWLVEQLTDEIRVRYPHLHYKEVKEIIDHFIFLGNGLFWGVVIYNDEDVKNNLTHATNLMNQYLQLKIGSVQNGGEQKTY
ncbi:TetR/AcrR family transcriptional regulator [Ornithinibacillus halotolerans]|uniref:TetR family transcriptional regulator n=1 Tax=Ornithinibacillus halotolerans TaxID=1274357 RepID=A0A916SBP6_9BACI|nr:TetR/AcrR family transcriptional regulator [Ornithinibacillus halotolerans]GGA90292.1 TetR family transcriptional regulator [Ornithinibacillus halotolerans]